MVGAQRAAPLRETNMPKAAVTMLSLLDYRRRVHDLYRTVRLQGTPDAFDIFRRERDALFASHPQSALDAAQQATFTGLRYYAYNPAYRVVAPLDYDVEPVTFDYDLGDDGRLTIRQFAQVAFDLPTGAGTLGVFWITGYGGGLFLPFRDSTNGQTTYGGGRYLYDTIKGADLAPTATPLSSTSTTLIIHRVTITRAGFAHSHRRRIGSRSPLKLAKCSCNRLKQEEF